MIAYRDFLDRKSQLRNDHGFDAKFMPKFLYRFQRCLVGWAVKRGRGAIFADCGLGKTPMELVWAENVARHTGKPVLILTPLAVGQQMVAEGEKFGIEAIRSKDGTAHRITVTNYQRLHYFNPQDFAGVVADESSILKSFDGRTRKAVTEFMRTVPYRLLATATAAPNDYVELGTSSEALGELGHVDMLTRFFKNDQNNISQRGMYRGHSAPRTYELVRWRFKGHAEIPFWRWVSSWARALRRPSDLGYEDNGFILPPLIEREHLVESETPPDGMLFSLRAVGLREQREERRRTIRERCEKVSELVSGSDGQSLVWCHLNREGDTLERMIPDSVQVSGSDDDDEKEARLLAFARGEVKVLVTKPKIAGWGLNLQKCAHVTFFPSHSYEQYYQGVRRCWRFGQERPVVVDIVTTEGEKNVMDNLRRKSAQADRMFSALVAEMNNAMSIRSEERSITAKVPSWL